jgi:alanine racemase
LNSNTNDLSLQRPTWTEIDLDAILSNYLEIKRIVSGAEVMAVVKADAYGHGASVIARALEQANVAFLATATPAEAVQLRQAAISVPILVLSGMTAEQLPLLRHHDFIPTIYDREFLTHLNEFAKRHRRSITVHLKVDTGMGRLGLAAEEAADMLRNPYPYIKIEGVFTHFATADLLDDSFTIEQLNQFARFVGDFPGIKWVHAANSAAVLNYPQSHFGLVRPGLLLYGISPMGEAPQFKPALSLKSKIIYLNQIQKGEAVGYGRTFVADRESLIATIPVGYSDGLRRSLSNKLMVDVRGKLCRIAGTISMDLSMIDVTDMADEVQLFDEVTLIGPRTTAWDWANLLNTIPYEITCLIGARVPRVYYRGGKIVDVYYP